MKFSAAAILSAAAVVSANAVFDITSFEASCIPHSSQCLYSFDVVKTAAGETVPITCTIQTPAAAGALLPEVNDVPCSASSRTFSIVRSALGLTLTVSEAVSPTSSLIGVHLLPAIALVKSTTPNALVESYTGPSLFSLTAL